MLTKKVNERVYECLRFPMKTMNISQGCNIGTHLGVDAIDICGKDSGIEPLFAPAKMQLMAYDRYENGNAVFFQTVEPVYFADGTIDYATMMFIHDDYIADIIAHGGVFKQWEEFGDEGTAGLATGNHCHFEIAKGKFTHMYDQNGYGVYHLPRSCSPDKCCFVDDVKILNGGQPWGGGRNNMTWVTTNSVKTVEEKAGTDLKVGDYKIIPESGVATFTKDNILVRREGPKGEVVAVYNSGNKVNYIGKWIGNGHRYVVFVGGSGKYNFVAVSGTEKQGEDPWAKFE